MVKHKKPAMDGGNKVYDLNVGPTPKRDYKKLKMEFFAGPWRTVRRFFKEKYGFKNIFDTNMRIKRQVKGWGAEKKIFLEHAMKMATQQLLAVKVDDEKMVLARQHKIGKLLQSKGIKALKDIDPKTIDDIRRLIATGVEIERKALGLNNKSKKPSKLTQVNVNLPETKFDKMVDELDYGGILKLIAEVRREKSRRSGTDVEIKGSSQVK